MAKPGHKRVFHPGSDAIILATAELPRTLKTAWDTLLTEVLQTTPERIASRLEPDTGEGVQSSASQRAFFNSFSPPSGLLKARAEAISPGCSTTFA